MLGGEGLREELGDGRGRGAGLAGDERAGFAVTGEHRIVERRFLLGGWGDGAAGHGQVHNDVYIGLFRWAETEKAGEERRDSGESDGGEGHSAPDLDWAEEHRR